MDGRIARERRHIYVPARYHSAARSPRWYRDQSSMVGSILQNGYWHVRGINRRPRVQIDQMSARRYLMSTDTFSNSVFEVELGIDPCPNCLLVHSLQSPRGYIGRHAISFGLHAFIKF